MVVALVGYVTREENMPVKKPNHGIGSRGEPLGGVRDPRHGTSTAYSYWGCRCSKCVVGYQEANNKSRARQLDRMLAEGIHDHRTYSLGHRCDKCRKAARAFRQSRPSRTLYSSAPTVDFSQLA